MISLFSDFRRDYGDTFSDVVDIDAAVIQSLYVTAEYYEAEGESREATRYYDQILEEFQIRQPDDINSRYAAANVVYERALETFEVWDSIEFGETVDSQTEALQSRRNGIQEVVLAFEPVYAYESADVSVCAAYMQGRVFQLMAETLLALPIPDFRGDIYAEDEYIIMVEDFAIQYEDEGILQWESLAYPMMQRNGVVNQCTIDTMRQLNRLRGPQYPVYREEIRHEQDYLFSPQIFAIPQQEEDDDSGRISIVSTEEDDESDAPDDDEGVEEDDPFAPDPE